MRRSCPPSWPRCECSLAAGRCGAPMRAAGWPRRMPGQETILDHTHQRHQGLAIDLLTSTSSALAAEQNLLMELTMPASMRDGDALLSISFNMEKFCRWYGQSHALSGTRYGNMAATHLLEVRPCQVRPCHVMSHRTHRVEIVLHRERQLEKEINQASSLEYLHNTCRV